MIDIIRYLWHEHHHRLKAYTETAYRGCCPIHEDRHPSFSVSLDKQPEKGGLWYCFACQRGGSLIDLINWLEFNGTNQQAAIKRFRALGGSLGFDHAGQHGSGWAGEPCSSSSSGHPPATPLQQALLKTAMEFWHEVFVARHTQLNRGRLFASERGIPFAFAREMVEVGYAPAVRTPYERELAQEFVRRLTLTVHLAGESSLAPAIELGLLTVQQESGELTPFYKDRLMMSSRDREGHVLFATGRMVLLASDHPSQQTWKQTHLRKYLGVRVAKVPLTLWHLPQERPELRHVLLCVEAGIGTLALGACGLHGWATHGSGLSETGGAFWPDLLALARIHVLAQDNDMPRQRKDGTLFFPGDEQAQRVAAFLQHKGVPSSAIHRLKPPTVEDKDLDSWLRRAGPAPLLQELTTLCYEGKREQGLEISHR